MRYTRRRGSQFALWPLLVLATAIGHRGGFSAAQDHFENGQLEGGVSGRFGQVTEEGPSEAGMEGMALATGKWNQFKGFYTPRPLPSDAHFTFASVWASWSAWSFCTNNIQMRVRACNTVRGFSCLGSNRDIRPCANPMPAPAPNRIRQRQFQILPNGDGHGQQFEADDPWADDRKEALRQLSPDYEGQKEPKEEVPLKTAPGGNGQAWVKPAQPIPSDSGPPGQRPEAFASKIVDGRKQILKSREGGGGGMEEDSLEEMNLEELADKLEVKEPSDFAAKLAELDTVEGDTEEKGDIGKMPKLATTTMASRKILLENEHPQRPLEHFHRSGNGRPSRVRPATPFTTSPPPSTRTTISEPRNRQKEELMPRNRTILGTMEREQRRGSGRRWGKEMEGGRGRGKGEGATVAEDTARALEWIMANMSKSIESAAQQKSSMARSGEGEKEGKLHSGESMVDSEEEEEEGKGKTTTAASTTRSSTMATKMGRIRSKGVVNRAMAVNSFRMAPKNEGNPVARVKHRQRLISELTKAQQAKQRQIERSREEIWQKNGDSGETAKMGRELARLRAEMHTMEAVLARMKADEGKEDAANNSESTELDPAAIGKRRKPEVVFPSIAARQQKSNEKQKQQMAKENGDGGGEKKEEEEQLTVVSGEIRAKNSPPSSRMAPDGPSANGETTIVGTRPPSPSITTTTQPTTTQSLILTEQPNSIWLAGSAPRAGSAQWSPWNDWGQCICGKQMRSRTCLFEDNTTFHSKGCVGRSYESRRCLSSAEMCPTTIPPIPPSKQKVPPPSRQTTLERSNLRRTALSIAHSTDSREERDEPKREEEEAERRRRRRRFWWIK